MGGGGKGGGGADAGPMLEYGQKALDIQKQIYDQTLDRSSPWYNAGTSAVERLSDLMGLSGGSLQTREQIYNDLLPQYTSQETSGGGGSMYIDEQGRVVDLSNPGSYLNGMDEGRSQVMGNVSNWFQQGNEDAIASQGFRPLSQSVTNDVIDRDGLNAAVAGQLEGQQTPNDFGALTERFDMNKYQADPGYQFRLDEGNKALERQMAASGRNFTPQALKALNKYNSGMASQEYGQAYDRYNIDQNNLFNRLASMSGMGQTAVQTTANAGTNYANQAGNIYGQMGNAVTSAQTANNSGGSMFGQLLGAGAQIAPLFL